MKRVITATFGAAALLAAQPCSADDVAFPGVLTLRENVAEFQSNNDTLVFSLLDADVYFRIEQANVPDFAAIVQAVSKARNDNVSVIIKVAPDTNGVALIGDVPVFRPLEVTAEGSSFHIPVSDVGAVPLTDLQQASVDAGLGALHFAAVSYQKAVDLESTALSQTALPQELKSLALLTRAKAEERLALDFFPPGDQRDQLLIKALEDCRQWKNLAPGRDVIDGMVADIYLDLGAYNEALAIYNAQKPSTDMAKFWNRIMTESAYRGQGNLESALGVLDQTAGQPLAESMPYHYHRGRDLFASGRFDDAHDEFTKGLKDQPDYQWAMVFDACTLAASGRLDEALAMQEKVVPTFATGVEGSPDTPQRINDRNVVTSGIQTLQTAIRKDAHTKVPGLCDGLWPEDLPRPRTNLTLPKQ